VIEVEQRKINKTKRGVVMPVGSQIRFCTTLLAGAAALTFACAIAEEASRNLEATVEASPQMSAKPPAIPAAGPLAEPKSLKQVGLPVEATRAAVPADNPQTPEKIALGQKLFFDGRLSVDGTVACSTCHDPARAFTEGDPPQSASKAASASAMRRLF